MTRVWCSKLDCVYNADGVCLAEEVQLWCRGSIMEHVICPNAPKRTQIGGLPLEQRE